MQGIRDRGWAVCCGQEVDSGDAWVESRRKRASAKQPEEIIRKDKRKKTADATEIPDGRGRTWSCIQGKWCGAERIWKLHDGNQKTDQGESSFRGGTSLRQPPRPGPVITATAGRRPPDLPSCCFRLVRMVTVSGAHAIIGQREHRRGARCLGEVCLKTSPL